jgi:hypothetical protein
MLARLLSVSAIGLLCLGFAGCTGKSGPKLTTYPVSGKITLNGEAVEGATVMFQPANPGGDVQGASGVTDKNGVYKLGSQKAGDGCMAGDFNVTVTKFESATPTGEAKTDLSVAEQTKLMEEAYKGQTAGAKGPTNLIPQKYSAGTTSGLTATVKPEGPNDFPFDLTGK